MSVQIRIKLKLSFGPRSGVNRLHSKPKTFSALSQDISTFLTENKYEYFDYNLLYIDGEEQVNLKTESDFEEAIEIASELKTKTLTVILQKVEKCLLQSQVSGQQIVKQKSINDEKQHPTPYFQNSNPQSHEIKEISALFQMFFEKNESIIPEEKYLIEDKSISDNDLKQLVFQKQESIQNIQSTTTLPNNDQIQEQIKSELSSIFAQTPSFWKALDDLQFLPLTTNLNMES